MQTVGGSSDGAYWVLAACIADPDCIPGSQLQISPPPAVVGIWGVNQHMGALSVSHFFFFFFNTGRTF